MSKYFQPITRSLAALALALLFAVLLPVGALAQPRPEPLTKEWVLSFPDSPPEPRADSLSRNQQGRHVDENGQPLNGIWKRYDENGTLVREVPYEGGLKNGLEKNYYSETGALGSEIPYTDGVVDGVMKTYRPKGSISQEIPYVKGKKQGVSREYWGGGGVSQEIPYENGQEHGLAKFYWPKGGHVEREMPFVEGTLHGVMKIYEQDGRVMAEYHYEHGEQVKKITY